MSETLYKNFIWGKTGELQDMLVRDGKVVWRDIVSPASTAHEVVDLTGKVVLPSFIDAHCHISITGLDMHSQSLAGCQSHQEVLNKVEERLKQSPSDKWLLAVDYNQNLFKEGTHITRTELDRVAPNTPVLLRHVSWHAAVANSAALKAAGIAPDVQDPSGGTFVRDTSGSLTGILLEDAYKMVSKATPKPTVEELTDALISAGSAMADFGIRCATDMMTGRYDLLLELEAYRRASEQGCPIRLRLCLEWHQVLGTRAVEKERLKESIEAMNPDLCKVWGVKIFADGAIGSSTAAIYGKYATADTDGILMYPPERLNKMVTSASEAGWQVAIHSIGDRCSDLVMDAYEMTDDPSRHRIEHIMLMSDAQIERLAKLGCHATMQPEFMARMGATYFKQLGEERARWIKRARSVIDAGIPLSFNSDRPIVLGDPWVGINAAVKRPDGYEQSENVTLAEAFNAYTHMGAVANNDEASMGALLPGQFADFQVLEENPFTE